MIRERRAMEKTLLDGCPGDVSHTKQSERPSRKEVHRVAPVVSEKAERREVNKDYG